MSSLVPRARRAARMACVSALTIAGILALVPATAGAQGASEGPPLLTTYGSRAPTGEGDPTYRQVIYFAVPEKTAERLFVRIFDPEAGGKHDLVYGRRDTLTSYIVQGGEGVFTGGIDTAATEATGKTLIEKTFDGDLETDDQWVTLGSVRAGDGDLGDGMRYFRLTVRGTTGNDGNIYGVAVSARRANRMVPPEGLRIFSYDPTIRVADRKHLTELRFQIPEGAKTLNIENFDAAHGMVTLTTRYRSVPLTASGQDNWKSDTVDLVAGEAGDVAAITFFRGREIPNDGTFRLTTDGEPLAFDLSPRMWVPNRRPEIATKVTPLASCRAAVFDGSASTDPDGDRLIHRWRLADGTVVEGQVMVRGYDKPGTYTERFEVEDDSGQVGDGRAKDVTVVIRDRPVARIDAIRDIVPGETVRFDASGSDTNGAGLARAEWSFSDGTRVTGLRVEKSFERPGSYVVGLDVTDDSGHPCDRSRTQRTVRVNAAPVPAIGVDRRVSVGQTVTFDGSASHDPDGHIVSHVWDFGDGAGSKDARATHSYSNPGVYTVTLTVEDETGIANSRQSRTVTIHVNAPPSVAAGTDRHLAIGDLITFDASGSTDPDGALIAYRWDFGDGNGATIERPVHAYTKAGTYIVKLTVEDDSGTDTRFASSEMTVVVNAVPVAIAGVDRRVTASVVDFDGTASRDDDGTIGSYEWDFGDGTTGTGARPSHVYKTPGRYVVKLTVTDTSGTRGGVATDTMVVLVNARPIADAGPDHVAAPGEKVVFQGSRSIDPDGRVASYEWNFKDGTRATGRIVEHAFDKPGKYVVELKVGDDTGDEEAVDFDETIVHVNAKPKADAGTDIRVAPGDTVTLDGGRSTDSDGTIAEWRWDFSDRDTPAQGKVVTRTFDKPGIYTATLTVADDSAVDNSVDSDEVRISVNHRPVADAGSDIVNASGFVAFDGTRSVDADGDGLTYTWDFGEGTTATGAKVEHRYAAGGTYPVVLTVDDGTGLKNASSSTAIKVHINRPPMAVAGGNKQLCSGDVLVLDGSKSRDPEGGVLRFAWDFGDGTKSTIVNPTKIYKVPGVYPVTLKVEDDSGFSNGTHTDRISVIVNPAPIADAGPDIKVCSNTPVAFDGSKSSDVDGVVNRYSWDFGDGNQGGGNRPTHIYRNPGAYRMTLTIEGDQLSQCDNIARDTAVVTVVEAPEAIVAAPRAAPVNVAVVFDGSKSVNSAGAVSGWSWDFGDGGTAAGAKASHTFTKPGVYNVDLTIDAPGALAQCRKVSARHRIVINAAPVPMIVSKDDISVGEFALFDASGSRDPDGGIQSYAWDFGDGGKAEGVVARHRFKTPGEHKVTLTVTDETGVANSSVSTVKTVRLHAAPIPRIDGPAKACAGEATMWSARLANGTLGEGAKVNWLFGDGGTSQSRATSHVFARTGHYDVTLHVDDGKGFENSRRNTTKKLHVNAPPHPVASVPRQACPGVAIRLDASGSNDPDGSITSYSWDFGDGTTGTGAAVDHAFEKPGKYKVLLSVADDAKAICSVQKREYVVTVNTPPSADAGGSREVYVGGAADDTLFSGWKSMDTDGNALTYRWKFGEGEEKAGERVRHRFSGPGAYPVTLTVSDTSGLSCGVTSDTVTITVKSRE